MADYKDNPNNRKLKKLVDLLGLTKPGSKIVMATGYDKGNVSSFLNNKKPVPDGLLQQLYNYYNVSEEILKKISVLDHNQNDDDNEDPLMELLFDRIVSSKSFIQRFCKTDEFVNEVTAIIRGSKLSDEQYEREILERLHKVGEEKK